MNRLSSFQSIYIFFSFLFGLSSKKNAPIVTSNNAENIKMLMIGNNAHVRIKDGVTLMTNPSGTHTVFLVKKQVTLVKANCFFYFQRDFWFICFYFCSSATVNNSIF